MFGRFACMADELHFVRFRARLRHVFCPPIHSIPLHLLHPPTAFLYFSFKGFKGALSARRGRVANAPFLACLSSDLGGVWSFRMHGRRASLGEFPSYVAPRFLSTCPLHSTPPTAFLYFSFKGFKGALSAWRGRVANAPFLACLSSDLGGVWSFRMHGRRASLCEFPS